MLSVVNAVSTRVRFDYFIIAARKVILLTHGKWVSLKMNWYVPVVYCQVYRTVIKYVWNVYCVVTNYKPQNTTETTGRWGFTGF